MYSASIAQLFGLLIESFNNVQDTAAAPARKDQDSKHGFGSLESSAANHSSTALLSDPNPSLLSLSFITGTAGVSRTSLKLLTNKLKSYAIDAKMYRAAD